MEDAPRLPGEAGNEEDDDDEEAEQTRRKRRTLSESVLAWLDEKQRSKEEEESKKEESGREVSDEAGTAKESFGAKIDSLFPAIVEKPKETADSSAQEAYDQASPQSETSQPEETPYLQYEEPPGLERPASEMPEPAEEPEPIVAPEIRDTAPETTETPASTEERELPRASEATLNTVLQPEQTAHVEAEHEGPVEPELPPVEARIPRDETPAGGGGAELPRSTNVEAPAPRTATYENSSPYPEKRGIRAALIAFLAAEIFSRGRDRKLRKEAAKQQKQLDEMKKQQQSTHFEQMSQSSKEKELKRRIETIETRKKVDLGRPAQEVPNSIYHTPDYLREMGGKSPEIKLKQQPASLEVAYGNINTEPAFEQRYEIKDQPKKELVMPPEQGKYQSGPSKVGEVLKLPEFDQARHLAQFGINQPVAGSSGAPSTYKRAAKAGFWVAIIIVIVATAIFLLG